VYNSDVTKAEENQKQTGGSSIHFLECLGQKTRTTPLQGRSKQEFPALYAQNGLAGQTVPIEFFDISPQIERYDADVEYTACL